MRRRLQADSTAVVDKNRRLYLKEPLINWFLPRELFSPFNFPAGFDVVACVSFYPSEQFNKDKILQVFLLSTS